MNGQWTPANEDRTATLPPFGRGLRGYFGDAAIGLPDDMLALLEKLLAVPGVFDDGGPHRAEHSPDRTALNA